MALDGSGVLLLVNTTGDVNSPNYVVVAGQRSVSFSEDTAEIDATSKDDGASGTFLPGRNSDTMSLEHLYELGDAGFGALKAARRNRQMIRVRKQENGVASEQADALITNMTTNFPDSDVSTVSLSLRISGGWSAV